MIWTLAVLLVLILAAFAIYAMKKPSSRVDREPQKQPSSEAMAFAILARHDIKNRFRSRAIQREIASDAARVKRELDQIPNDVKRGPGSMSDTQGR